MREENKGATSGPVQDTKPERLQKVLAQAGIASRRHAEELILGGHVTVNGEKIVILGSKVYPDDHIAVDGKFIKKSQGLYYYILNKPVGVITSVSDPHGRQTVLDLIKEAPVRLFPVGRLDYETSGLLVLTNDGNLAFRLTHPRYGVKKSYHVWLPGPVAERTLVELRDGVILEDGKTAPAVVKRLKPAMKGGLELLEMTIHEGKNRQIRRMCEVVGYPVAKLQRVRFGPLSLDPELKQGAYRKLNAREVRLLKKEVGLE
ncbi:pseudouridine synthase [Paradesulfitobacterium aromaticivorans]